MRTRTVAVAGALLVAGVVLAAKAQELPGRPGGPWGPGAGGPWRSGGPDPAALQAELGLSPEQAADLKKLRAEGRKQAIRQRADLAIARIELRELMDSPVVDQKAIDAKVKAISDLQAASLKARTERHLALRKLLTPEQQQKLKQMRQRRRVERPGRAFRRGRGPQGPGMPPVPPGPGGPTPEDDDLLAPEPER
jgi:Spy/CpxP family protein refolding chaperone